MVDDALTHFMVRGTRPVLPEVNACRSSTCSSCTVVTHAWSALEFERALVLMTHVNGELKVCCCLGSNMLGACLLQVVVFQIAADK